MKTDIARTDCIRALHARKSFGVALALILALSTSPLGAADTNSIDPLLLLKERRYSELEAILSTRIRIYELNISKEEESISSTFAPFASFDPKLERNFGEWIAKFPDSYSAHLARGMYWQALGNAARGDKYAHETPPENMRELERFLAKARPDLERSLKLTAKPVATYAQLILVGRNLGLMRENRLYLDEANRIEPANILTKEGYLLSIRPQWGGSLEAMEAFIKESQAMPISEAGKKRLESHKWRALARRSAINNDRRAAAEHYSTAIALHENAEVYFNRGTSYYLLHELESARNDLSKAIALDSKYAKAFLWRGFVFRELKEDSRAIEDFTRAMELNPQDIHPISNRGHLYAKRHEYSKSVPDLQRAADMGDDFSQYQLGLHYWHGNGVKVDKNRAIELWKASARKGNKAALHELDIEGLKP